MRRLLPVVVALAAVWAAPAEARNVIIFVADGLRYGSVEPANMPHMARLKAEGVDFTNSHSLYPTVTTVNASAIATGHYIGDTGNFGNTLFVARPMATLKGSTVGFLESNPVLAEMNEAFGGNYLNETSLIAAARAQGFQTAILGKEGPARIQDLTSPADGSGTLLLDDSTGREGGLGLPAWFSSRMKAAFMDDAAPKATLPDIEQESWLVKAATRIVLPQFKQTGKPFVMLFWSRDPDLSQHNARDSVGELVPGINNLTALAGARNADAQLGALMDYLRASGLDKDTDVFVTADHGFSTVAHDSKTSPSLKPGGELQSGFLAADLAATLKLPRSGNSGLLGADPAHPEVVVTINGGSDLIYLPGTNAKARAGEIVKFLAGQDYVSGIFVNDDLGKFPGALSMSDVNLMGSAQTPRPAIFVSFRTFSTGCADELQCTVQISDTTLATGQGNHGALSRAETRNFMAAIGPDFKSGFANPAPISNADITPTMASILNLRINPKGKLVGRVISEAIRNGADVTVERRTRVSAPGPGGVRTYLNEQSVGTTRYFDAAGFPGRTVGLKAP